MAPSNFQVLAEEARVDAVEIMAQRDPADQRQESRIEQHGRRQNHIPQADREAQRRQADKREPVKTDGAHQHSR